MPNSFKYNFGETEVNESKNHIPKKIKDTNENLKTYLNGSSQLMFLNLLAQHLATFLYLTPVGSF